MIPEDKEKTTNPEMEMAAAPEMPVEDTGVIPDATEDMAMETEAPAPRPLMDRMKQLYPDRELTDDELETAVIEHMDNMQKYKDSNDRLTQAFQENPELLAVVRDVLKGASIAVAIARNVDIDELKPMEGDPDYEEWGKAAETRKSTAAERAKMAQELSANLDMSAKEVEAFASENGFDEEKTNKLLADIDVFVGDVVRGKLTKNTLAKFMKAIDYETDIAEAEKVGEVKGKNAAYTKKKADKEQDTGDGLPELIGSGAAMKPEKKAMPKDPFMEAMEQETSKRKKFV